MADSSRLDTLMMLMALKAMGSDLKGKSLTPFTVGIQVSVTSVSCHSEGNKELIEDVGGQEWLKETHERIAPIMAEQTTKFVELLKKRFGISFKTEEQTAKSEIRFDEFLMELFGGG